MSYTPTTWTTGDTVTATKLNKIENGVANAGSVLICNSSYSSQAAAYVLDKTVQEIYDALLAGTPAYIKYQYGTISEYTGALYLAPIIKVYNYDNTNVIRICASKPDAYPVTGQSYSFVPCVLIYSATSLNAYPVFYNSVTSTSVAGSGVD